jgi:outer membrane protein assembly factor BamB
MQSDVMEELGAGTRAGSPPTQSTLIGSTTNGFVFAVDLATGTELWATQVSTQIAGVKGSVAGEYNIVLAASNRCRDRYCYRYRNETNNLEPGNSMVRGLSALSGDSVWEFKPESPVWNFVPLFGANGTVMFQDYEGSVYCLDWRTGALKWKTEGTMGTVSQASATYDPDLNIVYSLGVKKLESEWCNPATPPGILIQCSPHRDTAGIVRAYNAANGHKLWELDLPHVPAGATVGKIVGYGHYALVVGMGINCKYASTSALMAADAQNGNVIFERSGPTLWTEDCAGDKAGGDIRRAVGIRAACTPNSWSDPVIDKDGNIYIGSQVGQLQKWGLPNDTSVANDMQMLSTLSTYVALPDHSIAMAPGMMAISTCTSLIVLQTD